MGAGKLILFLMVGLPVRAADIVAEKGFYAECTDFDARRELRVYKDPTLFLPALALFLADPKQGWASLMKETPLMTSLKGKFRLKRLGHPTEFNNFGVIARLYELAEPRLRLSDKHSRLEATPVRIVPIQICDYDNLGFVLESDLLQATLDEENPGTIALPPSTHPNPIPVFKVRDERWK